MQSITSSSPSQHTPPPSGLSRFLTWIGKEGVARKAAYLITAASVISGIATAITMTGAQYNLQLVLYLLYADLILLLLLAGLVVAKLVAFWQERRRLATGVGLHTQLVLMFSLIAVTPAVLVAIFAAVFLNVGLQGWFSDKVRTAIEESSQVATAYLSEHQQGIRTEALAMANDLNRQAALLTSNQQQFNRVLTTQARLRGIAEAIVADQNGTILARSQFSQALEFDLAPDWALAQAASGESVLLTSEQDDRVRAIIRLSRFVDAYLIVGRFVDPRVIDHVTKVERGYKHYKAIEKKRGGFQITFVMLFVIVALLMLLAAAWIGLTLATNFTLPITKLVEAAEQVRDGNLDVNLIEGSHLSEIDTLTRAFNSMTTQLASQQEGLMEVNSQLEERRRFTETVLAGVSAGVIGLDQTGKINLPNRRASDLLQVNLLEMIHKRLSTVVPEMEELLNAAMTRPERLQQDEIRFERSGDTFTLLVRITAEREVEGNVIGYIVTFDDITALQDAQRQAAWADVARRIAHEIKNPLTPIQLSAERLKRKYLKQIENDPETFKSCTETIIRQVGDIGRMVDEFSSFARMPEPSLKPENLVEICQETVFLERNRVKDITVTFNKPDIDLYFHCDRPQITQAVTNLIKNAIESIIERISINPSESGKVVVSLNLIDNSTHPSIQIVVEDNGVGLPKHDRNRLTEPYVTNRDKGTGLGLAVVKKIVEDHEGSLHLNDSVNGGAYISMLFPYETG